jgi:hypothetical protein
MATITCYAPQSRRMRLSCFALPGAVSRLQADHVLQGESRRLQACEPAALRPLTNQAYVPLYGMYFLSVACVFPSIILLLRPVPPYRLFSRFNKVWRSVKGREWACARSLTGSLAVVRSSASGACSRGLTRLPASLWPSRTILVSLNRADRTYP